jgi:hypothetical protein
LILGNLKSKSNGVLRSWLSRYYLSILTPTSYDRESFLRILNVFHKFFDSHYHGSSPDDSVIAAVKFLSILYHANESANPLPILEISYFYNDSLCRKLNFKEEYKIWKRMASSGTLTSSASSSIPRSHSRNFSGGSPGFSFFNFPFLLDPVAKTRVMHIDAMTKMSLEFEDAFVHQALVIHAQRFLHDSVSVASFEQGMEAKTNPYLVLEVRRLRLVDDVLEQVAKKRDDLKKPLKGMLEAFNFQSNLSGEARKEWIKEECKRSFSRSWLICFLILHTECLFMTRKQDTIGLMAHRWRMKSNTSW